MEAASNHVHPAEGFLCEPCQIRVGESVAEKYCKHCKEFLCVTCADVHLSSKATKSHLLTNACDFGSQSVIENDFERLQKCKEHPTKELEYLCIDSGQFFCSACIITNKLEAKTLCYIKSAGNRLTAERYTDRIIADMDTIIETCKIAETNINGIKQACFVDQDKIRQQLNEVRLKVLTMLENQERQMLRQLETTKQSLVVSLNPQLQIVNDIRQAFEKNKNIYLAVINNCSKEDIFRCSFSVTKQIEELNDRLLLGQSVKHMVPVNVIKWSPVMVSLVNQTMPTMWCETTFIERESAFFQKFNVSQSSFTETIKQSTIERKQEKLEDYTKGSADADSDETFENKSMRSKIKHPNNKTTQKISGKSSIVKTM